jgi:hypothetical protein
LFHRPTEVDVSSAKAVLTEAAVAAYRGYGYGTDAIDAALVSVPTDILGALGRGLDDDALVITGSRFSLRGLGPKKGPYTGGLHRRLHGRRLPPPSAVHASDPARVARRLASGKLAPRSVHGVRP